MNILFIKHFFVGFMVSEIPRVSVFGYFPLHVLIFVKNLILSLYLKNVCIDISIYRYILYYL